MTKFKVVLERRLRGAPVGSTDDVIEAADTADEAVAELIRRWREAFPGDRRVPRPVSRRRLPVIYDLRHLCTAASATEGVSRVVVVVFLVGVGAFVLGVTAVLVIAGGRVSGRGRVPNADQLLLLAAESFPNGALLLFDRRLRHTVAGGRGLEAMGLSEAPVEGRTVRELFPPETWTVLEPAYRDALDGRESAFELPHGDRDHLHRVVPLRERSGATVGGMLVAQDITERKTQEHRLKQWASRDGLTGLWNRGQLLRELERMLSERRRDGQPSSLLYVDLDRFKEVNDSLGHLAGDRLLRAIARQLEGHVRFTDTVARIGGDEFAILLPATTIDEAEQVAEKLAAAVDEVWPDTTVGGASIGVIAIETGDADAADVLAAADREMYAVKRIHKRARQRRRRGYEPSPSLR